MLFKQIRPDAYLHLMHRGVERVGGGGSAVLKVLLEYGAWFRLVGFSRLSFWGGEE